MIDIKLESHGMSITTQSSRSLVISAEVEFVHAANAGGFVKFLPAV